MRSKLATSSKIKDRKIVILNQASNYLTIGFANAFFERFEHVSLITGSVRVQGEELHPNIEIHKINQWYERPVRKKVISYLKALISMWWLLQTKYRKHEVFFVSVPPMGYLLNLITPNRFSMVIWDVYPDTFKITGMRESHIVYKFWSFLNEKSFEKAFKIFTISENMAELIRVYTDKEIIIQPIWSIFQENCKVPKSENPFVQTHSLTGKFVVQYSGNIGVTHDVEALVSIAEILESNNGIHFQIIGRGPRKSVLEELVNKKKLRNCTFLPFQSEEMFPFSLSAADVGVVILDETTSKGSVPSKCYNLMSYGIPALYIASNDSQLFLYAQNYKLGKCFTKNELYEAALFLEELSLDASLYQEMSNGAALGSKDFRRGNADKFINNYLE